MFNIFSHQLKNTALNSIGPSFMVFTGLYHQVTKSEKTSFTHFTFTPKLLINPSPVVEHRDTLWYLADGNRLWNNPKLEVCDLQTNEQSRNLSVEKKKKKKTLLMTEHL